MKKEFLNAHNAQIAKRYGIVNISAFRRAARRYECRLSFLNELECSDEKRSEWAGREAELTAEKARKNLAKYCKYFKLFLKEFYINFDPRGYALKLDIEHKNVSRNFLCKVDRDWGRYFIIAPDIEK